MAECASSPNPIISKDILRKKTNEESRLKGEYRVECKKWSAKGTYRKASAEREPTQDLNTLGGQRPRADSGRKRAFRRAKVFSGIAPFFSSRFFASILGMIFDRFWLHFWITLLMSFHILALFFRVCFLYRSFIELRV